MHYTNLKAARSAANCLTLRSVICDDHYDWTKSSVSTCLLLLPLAEQRQLLPAHVCIKAACSNEPFGVETAVSAADCHI